MDSSEIVKAVKLLVRAFSTSCNYTSSHFLVETSEMHLSLYSILCGEDFIPSQVLLSRTAVSVF